MQKRLLIAATAAFLSLPLAITAAEEKKKGGGFGALDTNKDGKLTLTEYTAGQKGKDEATVKARFAALDTNNDTFVTAEEFSAGMKKKGEGKKKNP